MTTTAHRPTTRTITALLITDWCTPCAATTDQELNTVALTAECVECHNEVQVSETYATEMIEE